MQKAKQSTTFGDKLYLVTCDEQMWTYLKNLKNKFRVRENFYKKTDVYIV